MNIANPDNQPVVTDDHPTGVLGFRYLLNGTPLTPENYMVQIAENLGHFKMVTHRHNFDQFRYVISGQMNLGEGRVLKEGELCYFPEGTSYGPQDDPAGPVALVMQFGGASGYGYMSPQQYRQGREELRRIGRFEGPVFVKQDANGKVSKKLSINAIWEQAMGERLLIPAPRYSDVVIMKPKAFRWMPSAIGRGVFRKLLGSFSERGITAEVFKVKARGLLPVINEDAIRVYFVLSGEGRIGGCRIERHCAADFQPGEQGQIAADSELEMLAFRLPMLSRDLQDPQLSSTEPLPGESVAEQS
ncbi:cupin domain-containing protein [Variovorax paradoxus]|uniref:cupin domain-containing protein n=1 Tax=Variovorax paradoxus TaxID=34073 RepID=UPI0019327D84|nr:cupin domain-containing protein [Variovorax paradoxus]